MDATQENLDVGRGCRRFDNVRQQQTKQSPQPFARGPDGLPATPADDFHGNAPSAAKRFKFAKNIVYYPDDVDARVQRGIEAPT